MVGNSSRDADLQKVILTVAKVDSTAPMQPIGRNNTRYEQSHQKLSFFEKAGYSGGDAAANFVFMTMILFQIELLHGRVRPDRQRRRGHSAVAAVLGRLLSIRSWASSPTAPNTRWGKFRPWVLWTAVPWAVVMVLAYTTPRAGAWAR